MVKAIFCINPGRSGSHYLSGLLAESTNCESHHEAKPHGFGLPLQEFQRGRPGQMAEVARAIAGSVRDANDRGRIYSDTSHCFIKGFGWLIMEHLDPSDVGVVILKRDKQAVVNSTFRAQSGPMKNLGRRYTMTPERHAPLLPPPRFLGLGARPGYALARGLHYLAMKGLGLRRRLGLKASDTQLFSAYQKAVIDWYWEETYALAEAFKNRFPDCSYFEAGTEDLNRIEVVRDLFDRFGVTPNQVLEDKVGVPTNLKLGAGG